LYAVPNFGASAINGSRSMGRVDLDSEKFYRMFVSLMTACIAT
jgi:hypothetical protein